MDNDFSQTETIVNRVWSLLKNPDIGDYNKREAIKKLVSLIEPEKRAILSIAIELTPTPEQIAKEKASQFPETKGK